MFTMDDSTTEKKALQIDTSLTATTSELTLSSTDSGFTTPQAKCSILASVVSSNNEQELNEKKWKNFYDRVQRTPPKATRETDYDKTLATAKKLLELSDSKNFNDLTDDQQAILFFMILKNMHEVFGPSLYQNAKQLVIALDPVSKAHKRMLSFVRLGGDRAHSRGRLMELSNKSFIDKFPDWDKTGTTIFKKNPNMTPFVHLQDEESYICTYAACSALLYYTSYNKRDVDDKNKFIFKMNISRYIRDEVSGRQIANFTLTDMKGDYLDEVLLGLLQSFGTDDCQKIKEIDTWVDDEDLNFRLLESYLRKGRPIVFSVETLPAFTNYEKQKFFGKVSDYFDTCKCNRLPDKPKDGDFERCNCRPNNPKDRAYHAVICVGIKPRDGDTPPMLLVQDSCHRRPFFAIGLDLLMDMGMENLQFYTVPEKWSFNKNMDYLMKPETRSLFCGSPMCLDSNGVPRVLRAEVTAVERRDMSRYLDLVDPNKGPHVYVT